MNGYEPSGVFVTPEELGRLQNAQATSGMWMPGGVPIGNPQQIVDGLGRKYGMPDGTPINAATGEFFKAVQS